MGTRKAFDPLNPIFVDPTGLPPLISRAGTHEVLLDAVRLAQQAAFADVEVVLDVTPQVVHVFPCFHPLLDGFVAAPDRAGRFLSARPAGTEPAAAITAIE